MPTQSKYSVNTDDSREAEVVTLHPYHVLETLSIISMASQQPCYTDITKYKDTVR